MGMTWAGLGRSNESNDDDARLLFEHEATDAEWAEYEAHMAKRREETRVTATVPDWTIDFSDVPF